MIGHRTALGLSLLSALLFCAFAAQGASAALTTSKNTTGFTCVKDPFGKGKFLDEHCDGTALGAEGLYEHSSFAGGTEVDVTATTSMVLKSKLFGTKTEIECAFGSNIPKSSSVQNTEPAAGQHTFSGTIETRFTSCTVKAPSKCAVGEPIVSKATVHGVEGLEGPKNELNAMGLEFIGDGEEETFAEITYIGAECALKNVKVKVKGKAIATGGPTAESAQANKESGATLVFTPKFKMQELKLGPEAAELTTTLTLRMTGVGGNPISFTTTT